MICVNIQKQAILYSIALAYIYIYIYIYYSSCSNIKQTVTLCVNHQYYIMCLLLLERWTATCSILQGTKKNHWLTLRHGDPLSLMAPTKTLLEVWRSSIDSFVMWLLHCEIKYTHLNSIFITEWWFKNNIGVIPVWVVFWICIVLHHYDSEVFICTLYACDFKTEKNYILFLS